MYQGPWSYNPGDSSATMTFSRGSIHCFFLSVLDLFFITKRNLFSDERNCCVFLLRLLKLWENATDLGNKRYIYWLRWKSSNIEYYIHAVSKFMTHISRSFTGDYVLQRNPLFGSIMQWHYKHLIHLWYWETNVFYCKLFTFHILRGSSMAQKNQVSLVNLASKMRRLITKSTWPVEEMCCTIPKVNNHSQLLHGNNWAVWGAVSRIVQPPDWRFEASLGLGCVFCP